MLLVSIILGINQHKDKICNIRKCWYYSMFPNIVSFLPCVSFNMKQNSENTDYKLLHIFRKIYHHLFAIIKQLMPVQVLNTNIKLAFTVMTTTVYMCANLHLVYVHINMMLCIYHQSLQSSPLIRNLLIRHFWL